MAAVCFSLGVVTGLRGITHDFPITIEQWMQFMSSTNDMYEHCPLPFWQASGKWCSSTFLTSSNSWACNILVLWVFLKWEVLLSTSPIWVASHQELHHPSLHYHSTALARSASLPKWMEQRSQGGQILNWQFTGFSFLIEVYLVRWSWTGVCQILCTNEHPGHIQ